MLLKHRQLLLIFFNSVTQIRHRAYINTFNPVIYKYTITFLLIPAILLLKNTHFVLILCYSNTHTHTHTQSPIETFNPIIKKYTHGGLLVRSTLLH